MGLYHAYDEVENSNTGVPMAGVQVVPVFPNTGDGGSGVAAPIYVDESSTPFVPANYCVTDATGMYSFYIEPGSYNLDFFIGSKFIRRIADVQFIDPIPTNVEEPYRATLTEAINEFPIGFYFRSDDKNAEGPYPQDMWIYQRIGLAPYYLPLVSNTASMAELNAAVGEAEAAAANALNYGNAAIRSGFVAADAESWTAGAWVQVLSSDTGTHASKAGDFGASGGQTPNTGVFQEDPNGVLGLIRKAATVDVDAKAAATLAQAWSESTTAPDGGSGKSSKTWAGEASASAASISGKTAVIDRLDANVGKITSSVSPEPLFQAVGTDRRPWWLVTPTKFIHPIISALSANVSTLLSAVGQFSSAASPLPTFQLTGLDKRPWFSASPAKIRHAQVDQIAADLDGVTGRSGKTLAALAEYLHFIMDGQSLALGYGAAAISTSPLSYALRFNAGVRAQDGGADVAANHASLQPLIETTIGSGNSQQGETPAYGAMQMMAQLLLAENGIDVSTWNRKWIASAPGTPGTAIANLGSGSASFTRLTADMTYGATLAAAAGKSFQPQAVFWAQGEQDISLMTPASTYKNALRTLRSDAEYQARVASGIADMVLPLITYQLASHPSYSRTYPAIGLAQLDLAADDAIALACPTYFLPFDPANAPHLLSAGYKWLGAYFGLAAKRWFVDGVKPVPLRPTSIRRSGKTLLARFPVGKFALTIDTTTVPAQANSGFSLVDTTGAAQTISNVRIVGVDTIAIDCANTPAAGWLLRYAFTGDAIRGIGNLRDNQGDTLIFDPVGINKPMHRWVPIFEQGVL